jgi:hypothetical protein
MLKRSGLVIVLPLLGCGGTAADAADETPTATASAALKIDNPPACPKKEPTAGDACTQSRLACDYHSKTCSSQIVELTCVCLAGSHCGVIAWQSACAP